MNRHVGKEICRLQNQITRNAYKHEFGEEITRTQGRVLYFIYRLSKEKEVYQKDIENEFNLRRPSATELLQKLECGSFIHRISDEKDKRIKRIEISSKGIQYVEAIGKNINLLEEKIQRNIPKEELDIFFSVIEKMVENCEEE